MYIISATETFSKFLRKHKKNNELLMELDKKISRLKENPDAVGGNLSGSLHQYRSTRLSKKFRLIFRVDEDNKTVYLEALDHRKDVY